MLYYALTIFLSAFLLFQIQPMISKYILPWFGGTPAVWSTSMLFFQVILLGGYAYAHLFALRLQPRKQGGVHILFLLSAAVVLFVLSLSWGTPLLPNASFKPPDSSHPIWRILLILLLSVGLPYFVLSTTGPLLQTWFRYTYPDRSPYRLYALSNLGSLLGLVTYPILVEPNLTLRLQAVMWTGGFLTFAILCAFGAYKMSRIKVLDDKSPNPEVTKGNEESAPEVGGRRYLLWLLLATCASVMLLATTNQMCQEIAVIPFLWVLPLTLYLLSFILAFDSPKWYSRTWYTIGLLVSTIAVVIVIVQGASFNILIQITTLSIMLFFVFMVCHGELYKLRPDPRHLTSFYLVVSLGGAAGGLFVNFAAPWLFNGYWEFYLGILATWLLVLILFLSEKYLVLRGPGWIKTPLMGGWIIFLGLFVLMLVNAFTKASLEANRNFYGVLKVVERTVDLPEEANLALSHGVTLHGFQYQADHKKGIPTSYYGQSTGAGVAFYRYRDYIVSHSNRAELRVGVIGLGVATLAAYAEPGDYLRFYEINPEVIRLAEGKNDYFTFLRDTKGLYEVVEGDARISMEKELNESGSQKFDLLFIDAFSSDSVPVHLLTQEAFDVYLQHLIHQGVLAFHVSNHHLDLYSVVQKQAENNHLQSVYLTTGEKDDEHPSAWMLLSYNRTFFETPEIVSRNQIEEARPIKGWTDDYSNLFLILK